MKLQDNLVLFNYITSLITDDYELLVSVLKSVDEGRRLDGHSNYFSEFEVRSSHLALDARGTEQSLNRLKVYDLNILIHEEKIGKDRPGFQLKYFQYLAALYTEIYLDRYTSDPAGLLIELNHYRGFKFPDIPEFTSKSLSKLAFWMATGSGKTLLMHINILQYLHYSKGKPSTILLLTPGETLTRQHLEYLHESGFTDSVYALNAPLDHEGVQVLEITKMYLEGNEASKPKGGVSLPTSTYEGPTLLLVDEGHKGSKTKAERETERAWRGIRESLANNDGFTFEYSATFAQVTEGDDEIFNEYAHAILSEYAYARFHRDGYGKDFRVINVDQDDLYGERLLMGGLLSFYQQRLLFDSEKESAKNYQLENPLMVFVGSHVTGGNEVLQVVQFLNRVLTDSKWSINVITQYLAKESGFSGTDGEDVFAGFFDYLDSCNLSATHVYNDLCTKLFRGKGNLILQLITQADGEIGLKTADSSDDAYFGVINVGDASGFLKKVRNETTIVVAEDNRITRSVFGEINESHSSINFLIGSKKFIEGWSSWRVSAMGLLKVGKGAGAQILQLFGRGIRLKGQNLGLKRSEALAGDHPRFLSILETLTIFGVQANYLHEFLTTLDREGVIPPVHRILPILTVSNLDQIGLLVVETRATYNFIEEESVIFDPIAENLDITVNMNPRMILGSGESVEKIAIDQEPSKIDETIISTDLLEFLFYQAIEYKSQRGWSNLYITRPSIHEFIKNCARVSGPPDLLIPSDKEHLSILYEVLSNLVKKGLDSFYYKKQTQSESLNIASVKLDLNHGNFPIANKLEKDTTQEVIAYKLRIPPELVDEVDKIIGDSKKLEAGSLAMPLPRMKIDSHLYWPLLLVDQGVLKGGRVNLSKTDSKVSSTPTGLVEGEIQFILDLESSWYKHLKSKIWTGYEIYLLRNLPKKGIGFFSTVGFYPDFLLWLKKGKKQALAFIDPKGMAFGSWLKVDLLKTIRSISGTAGFPVYAYIVTQTELNKIQFPPHITIKTADKEKWLESNFVFRQEKNYIETILNEMKESLEV